MQFRALIVLLLSCCAVSQTPDPAPVDGRISGSVVNEDGKPVPGASVYLTEESSSLVDANSIVARTDVLGRFDFGPKLKHGVYEIYARKDKDCYPDPTSKFYQPLNFSPQQVQLFGDHPAEKVDLQLMKKAATVVGRVFDADTGRPLRAAVGFTNLRTDADHQVFANGKFYALVPADTDVFIFAEVRNEGEHYTDWSVFRTKVTLKPGQKMEIDVPLYKMATPDLSSDGPTSQSDRQHNLRKLAPYIYS